MIEPKPEADRTEGLRLSFNYLMLVDLSKGNNGYRHLEARLNAENDLRNWFVQNLNGLPEQENILKENNV